MKKIALGLSIFGLTFAGQDKPAETGCVSAKVFQQELVQTLKNPFLKVVKVEKDKYIEGLCDAVINFRGTKLILYTDRSGRYLFLGGRGGLVSIIDLKTGENITQSQLEELNKLSKEQLKELDKYVAFTYGHKGKVVYLFTDPECPFCQRIEPILKKWADEGKIQIKVVLFPLPFHPHARQKAIAMVCQNIGWKGLRNSYWTSERMKELNNWQCKKGEEFVKKSFEIGEKYGVSGTPTIITENGIKIVGALPEKELAKKLGINQTGENAEKK